MKRSGIASSRFALAGLIDIVAYCGACPPAAATALATAGTLDPGLRRFLLAPASLMETWALATFATLVFAFPLSIVLVAWSEHRGRGAVAWYPLLGTAAAVGTYALISAINGALPRMPESLGTAAGGLVGGAVFGVMRGVLRRVALPAKSGSSTAEAGRRPE